jgi:hypothetical protein
MTVPASSPGPLIGLIFLIDAIILDFVAVLVFRKDSKNLLNRLTALAMITFGAYLFFEGLIYILPLDPFYPVVFNIFRDISASAAIIAAVIGALTGILIYKGEHYVSRVQVAGPILAAGMIGIILTLPNDSVNYVVAQDTLGFAMSIWAIIGLLLIPVSLMAIATFYFIRTLRSVDRSHAKYQKAFALSIALLLVTVGIAYYSAFNLLGILLPFLGLLGHIFFLLASFCFFYAFR